MSGKRVLQPYEVLMVNAPLRPPRTTSSSSSSEHVRKISKPNESSNGDDEVKNHRQAIQEYRETCDVTRSWVATEALLYLAHDGDKIIERHALWLFPNPNERYLIASSNEEGHHNHVVEEYYILVRFEGKNSLDKLSLGICKVAKGDTHTQTHTQTHEYTASSSTEHAPLELDPTEGYVIRILSIERDGEPLQQPEHSSPLLQNAKHIQEVVRKHTGKISQISETLHYKFGVLRTTEYLEAKDMLHSDECGTDEWYASLKTLEDQQNETSSYPWKLANRVAQLGLMAKLRLAESQLLQHGKMHITENIWLVDETLPLESSEFVVGARWAVQKSIRGSGSIPRAKMFEPVVLLNHQDKEEFCLMRMA